MEKLLIYWPFSPFSEIHLVKEAGGLANAFTKMGKSVDLLVGEMQCSPPNGVSVYETGNKSWLNWRGYFKEFLTALSILIKNQYSIIIAFNSGPLNWAIFLLYRLICLFRVGKLRTSRAKLILKLDSDGTFRGFSTLNLIVYKILFFFNSFLFDDLMVESPQAVSNIKNMMMVNKSKVKYLPNGYSSIDYPKANYNDYNRKDVILSVSRVSREKGIEVLVKAFADASEEFYSWKLIIAGSFDDDTYLQEINKLIADLNLSERVIMLGELDKNKLREFYLSSAIFALVSIRESFGIARLEAMASGLPVLTSESGIGNELRGFGSIVVKCGDVKSTANQLKRLISNESLRIQIANEQCKHLISWEDVAFKIINI